MMANQSLESSRLPFPHFRTVDLIAAANEECPVVAVGEDQNFFVGWRLNHTSQPIPADSSIIVVVWRIRNADTTKDVMLAQHYRNDGEPIGSLFEIQTFTDVLRVSERFNPSLVFYCSNYS